MVFVVAHPAGYVSRTLILALDTVDTDRIIIRRGPVRFCLASLTPLCVAVPIRVLTPPPLHEQGAVPSSYCWVEAADRWPGHSSPCPATQHASQE